MPGACWWLAVLGQDPFSADIRPTPWQSPEQERAALVAPAGFTVTCFAAEPALAKPLNLAFDARGRLWCTSTIEYPHPVGAERDFRGRDRLTLHADRGGGGGARGARSGRAGSGRPCRGRHRALAGRGARAGRVGAGARRRGRRWPS